MTTASTTYQRQPVDAALRWDAAAGRFDLFIDTGAADLLAEDTLLTATVLSLMTDRTASADEVASGDRRGWWADAFGDVGDQYGSRLWLLGREKQLQSTMDRARAYMAEALAWLVDDGLATSVDVVVFAPRMGWMVAQITVQLDGASRRYRFRWSDEQQTWTIEGDA